MYCKKCGNPIGDDLKCNSCGFQNVLEGTLENKKEPETMSVHNEINDFSKVEIKDENINQSIERNKIWAWLSGIMFVISMIPLYEGYDKMTNYYSSDTYDSLNKNAYVGGDAYNYIINAGYSTAFFVLAIGAALLGVGFLIVYYISGKKVS